MNLSRDGLCYILKGKRVDGCFPKCCTKALFMKERPSAGKVDPFGQLVVLIPALGTSIDRDVADRYFHMTLRCLKDAKPKDDLLNGIAVKTSEFRGIGVE